MRVRRFAAGGFIVLLVATVNAWAQPAAVMTLTELDSLLKKGQPVPGYFDSVPKGLAMKRYPITIRGIADTPFGQEVIFTSQYRIVAGMSGSPVYVRGQLLGALATSQNMFEQGDFWGGITLFTDMWKEDQKGADKKNGRPPSFLYQGRLFSPIALGHQSIPVEIEEELTKRGFLTNDLKDSRVVITRTFVSRAKQSTERSLLDRTSRPRLLRPGMPIVVDLMEWKDQEENLNLISALGTITYVDRHTGRVYAFGHSFLDAKKVRYTFRSAEIIGTTLSDFSSFKIAGRKSEVLGLIDYDSTRGVFGRVGLEGQEFLPRFDLELQREGRTYQKLRVRMGDSRSFLPLFFNLSLIFIGNAYGVPVANETSSTEWTTQIELKDHPPFFFQRYFSSLELKMADRIVRRSSYDEAMESFVTGIFMPLFLSSYNFTFEKIVLRANFFPHQLKQIKLAALRFPTKLIWGEDPTLEVKMVGEDNLLALEKKIRVKVDWSKVEEPIYGLSVSELEKDKDKVVDGLLAIFSPKQIHNIAKSEKERQQERPDFFLGPEDFLRFFKEHFQMVERTIQGKLFFRARQQTGEVGILREEESILGSETKIDNLAWRVIPGGVSRRWPVLSNEDYHSFLLSFPEFPSGYIADPELRKFLTFEVIKK